MDMLLVILGGLAILAGIVGCVLPFLPGPPVAWLGLLLLHFSAYADLSVKTLLITAGVTLVIILADLLLPVWAAKRSGVSRAARYGVVIGMIAGLFFGPWGILAGPLAGAFLGELLARRGDADRAWKAAWSAFKGFLFGTGLKLLWCFVMAWWFLRALLG